MKKANKKTATIARWILSDMGRIKEINSYNIVLNWDLYKMLVLDITRDRIEGIHIEDPNIRGKLLTELLQHLQESELNDDFTRFN